MASAYQDILGGKLSLAQVAGQLRARSAKALAYEMAVCVCHADGLLQEPERRFLADLRQALQLDSSSVDESMLEEARGMQGRYSGDIAQTARQVNVSELLPLVRPQ